MDRNLSREVGYRLWQLQHRQQRALEAALADLQLTLPQFATLAHLVDQPGLSAADLARLLHLTPQAVSLLITRLQSAGHISRTRPKTGRSHPLTVTAAGVRTLELARPVVAATSREVLGAIDDGELAALHDMLGRCLARFE